MNEGNGATNENTNGTAEQTTEGLGSTLQSPAIAEDQAPAPIEQTAPMLIDEAEAKEAAEVSLTPDLPSRHAVTVQPGETLIQIAGNHRIPSYSLLKYNSMEESEFAEGRELFIPLSYRIQPGETFEGICQEFGVDPNFVSDLNGINPDLIFVGQHIYI